MVTAGASLADFATSIEPLAFHQQGEGASWDALFLLDLRFFIVHAAICFSFHCNGSALDRLDLELHLVGPTTIRPTSLLTHL